MRMLLYFTLGATLGCQSPTTRNPNFILIYADDLGYGDLGCFGSKKNRTPHLDRMAEQGMKLTSFYVTSGVCSPSRSSLMTGCYPRRVSMHQDAGGRWVLFPKSRKGLHPDEITVAEVLKGRGYATACIGKWHLGDQLTFLPTRQGFDSYFGIPYSNDMARKGIPLPLMRGEKVIEAPVDQSTLTKRYTEEAIEFIKANHDRPFFLYLPHTMVHLPLHASAAFKGKSNNGRYGDAVEELDWSTGEILKTLAALGIDEHTLVIFTSDNGSNRRNGGSNAPLRGGKGSTNEGGMRVPCIARWPGHVPAGSVCDEIVSTLDVLPTFAGLAGGSAPTDRRIDGHDIRPLLEGIEAAKSPREAFFYFDIKQLQAVRSGKWKLTLPRQTRPRRDRPRRDLPLRLFDLDADIHEDTDVSSQHPEVVKRLLALADVVKADLGHADKRGANQRPAGMVDYPSPRVLER